MRDRKVPVHTVGIGSEKGLKDLEIVKIDAPRRVEEDFPVEIWATIRRTGYDLHTVTISLKDKNRVLKQQTVDLDKEHPTRRVSIKFIPRNPGTQKYVLEIPPEAEEAIPQNNTKKFLIKVVLSKRVKILYVEGRPRWELAFITRTLKNDPNIQLTGRWITAEKHFGGIRSATEHTFGLYPNSKEVLFDYDAIIFGNIAASAFTEEQLDNTVEFVRTRGGGFLMLGGSNSSGNSNMVDAYINTPIAPMLPVELELGKLPVSTVSRRRFSTPPPQDQQPSSNESYVLQLTPEGKADPLMALADDPRANAATTILNRLQ